MAHKLEEISEIDYDKLSSNALKFSKNFSAKKSIDKMVLEYGRLILHI